MFLATKRLIQKQQIVQPLFLRSMQTAQRPMPFAMNTIRQFHQKNTTATEESTTALMALLGNDKEQDYKWKQREAYDNMMNERTRSSEEINEMANVYFKMLDKNETVNWDVFDLILQQTLQYAMENQVEVKSFIDRWEDIFTHFERRANRQEYPAVRFLVYLNFACVIQLNGETVDLLLRTGSDILYNKLHWPDKLQLLDMCNRANAPYKQNVFNKIAIDIML